MKEYRIDLKVRNNLILSRIEEMGFPSALSFCNKIDISYTQLMQVLNMRKSIYKKNGEIRDFIVKLCSALNSSIEELFSANQMEAELKTNKHTLEVNEAEMKFMLQNSNEVLSLEDGIFEEQKSKAIDNLLSLITPRERMVIEMRNGLGDYDAMTLKEIGEKIGCGVERTRQIEAKALRKLRWPGRTEEIKNYLQER